MWRFQFCFCFFLQDLAHKRIARASFVAFRLVRLTVNNVVKNYIAYLKCIYVLNVIRYSKLAMWCLKGQVCQGVVLCAHDQNVVGFEICCASSCSRFNSNVLNDVDANNPGVSNFEDMCVADSLAAVAQRSSWTMSDLNKLWYRPCEQR